MAEILSVDSKNDSKNRPSKSRRFSIVKSSRSVWETFLRQDKFTKLLILTIIAVITLFPVLSDPKRLINIFVKGEQCETSVTGFDAASVNLARDAAGPGAVICFPAGTYTGNFTASAQDQTWSLEKEAKIMGRVTISAAGVTIKGGTIESPTNDKWAYSVGISADDVTVKEINFVAGGAVIGVFGKDRTKILNNKFRGQTNMAIALWGGGAGSGIGSDDTLIEGNDIIQTATVKTSPIISRGSEDCTGFNRRTIVRNNYMDQGPQDIGWFGMEFKCSPNAVFEGNTLKGAEVLISLPESDAATIRNNTFDFSTEGNYWGIEVPRSNDTIIEYNTFIGRGTHSGAAVSMNTNPLRTKIQYNKLSNMNTLLQSSGDYHLMTDNCMQNVQYEYTYIKGANSVFEKNNETTCATLPAYPGLSTPSPTPAPTVSSGTGGTSFLSRPSSPAIKLSGTACNNLIIENKTFKDLGADVEAIRLDGCNNVTIRNNDFANVAQGITVYNSTNIKIEGNRYQNIIGPHARVGKNRANFAQLANVRDGYLSNNKGVGGDTEDIVNMYGSGGSSSTSPFIIENNHFEGTNWTSTAGSGIALGDNGGSNIIARNNILLNPGQVGMFIAGGTNIKILNNKVYGEKRQYSNVGLYVWNQYSHACSGHEVSENQTKWFNEAGSLNAFWNSGNCGTVAQSGNNFNAALDPNTMRVDLNAGAVAVSPTPTPTPAPVGGVSPTPTPTPVVSGSLPPAAGPLPAGYQFYKAINTAGGQLTVDGRIFAAESVSGVTHNGSLYNTSTATLSPVVDVAKQDMIRTGNWNSGGTFTTNALLPNGSYEVYLYTWEDNNPINYSLSVEGATVLSNVSTGPANSWRKIGPYTANVADGNLTVTATGGHFILSGIEIYNKIPPTPTPVPTAINRFNVNYYNNSGLADPVYSTGIENYPINKNWGTTGPGGGLPGQDWSADYTGVFAFTAGDYEFTAASDDGVRVILDGKPVITSWKGQALTTVKATVPVTAGNHEVKVEYFQLGGPAALALSWTRLSPTPTPTPIAPVFYKGVNLNGSAVTIEGNRWYSSQEASAQGFTTNGWNWSGSYKFSFNPLADSDTLAMLRSALWKSRKGFSVSQTLPNGTYDLYFWNIENSSSNARAFDIKLEGQTVAAAIGTQPLGSWRKYGPYRTTVTDGTLNIDTVAIKGDPSLFGMAIYSLDPNVKPATPTTSGDGLSGLYYSTKDLTGIPAFRKDAQIDFNWFLGSPMSGMPSNNFSIRWTGFIVASKTEKYTFYTTSDDGARLWVNNVRLVNNWKGQAATEASGSIDLVAGQRYPITIEYMELGSVASMNLKWSSPTTPKAIIPTSVLFSK